MHRSCWSLAWLLLLVTGGCSGEPVASSGQTSGSTSAGAGGTGPGGTGTGASGGAGGGGAGGAASDALDALLTANMAEAHMPGLAACIVKGGKVAWCNGYGLADIEANRAVTPDTVFLIASVSKTVTAVALMQLWENGAFELDDDVAMALPFAVDHPSSGLPITYRGLLTHTASVRDNWDVINLF
jgi:CubicO group peptidase (beta-lactamase class C family)